MLTTGESTGYDIRKRASEGAYRHFVEASFGSIYPALAKLEADGCVERREEVRPNRPPAKVYSITRKGECEFREALTAPIQRDVFRSPFLMVALYAHALDGDVLVQAIDAQLANLREDLAEIEAEAADSEAPGAGWVERFARNTINASIDFLERNRAELEAMADAGSAPFVEAAE